MTSLGAFTQVAPELEPVLEELRRHEPIFHTEEFGRTPADFDRRMAPGYWEVGGSGRRYSRGFILAGLTEHPPLDAAVAGWGCSDFGLRQLGLETYLLTYTLRQGERVTRRATVWERTASGWQILYHQGTIVAGVEDDTIPGPHELSRPHIA